MLAQKALALDKQLSEFDDYLRFGTDEEKQKSKASREAYLWTVKLFLQFCVDRQPTPALAKEWIKTCEEKGNGPRTVNRHIWALKSFFHFIGGDQLKIRGLTVDKDVIPRFLTNEEWNILLATAQSPLNNRSLPDYARQRAKLEIALLYVYCSALRATEAVTLEKDDVITAPTPCLRVMGKGRKQRLVPIEAPVLKALREYIASRPDNGPWIFPGMAPDSHMARRTAQGIIKALCVRAGLPDVHIHSLRHTAGYQMCKGGASDRDIQEVMGHANLATTRLYTHMVTEDLAKRLPKRFLEHRQERLV